MTAKTATPTVGDAKYNRKVAAGIRAAGTAGKANWTIGDLAADVATSYGDDTMQRFADDIGMAVGTLRNCRTVAGKYGTDQREINGNGWSVYETFASKLFDADRITLLTAGPDSTGTVWTARAAKDLAKARRDALNAPAGGESDESDESDETVEIDTLVTADEDVARLYAELSKAVVKANKIRRARKLPTYAKVVAPVVDTPAADEPKAPAANAPKAPAADEPKAPAANAPKAPAANAPKAPAAKVPAVVASSGSLAEAKARHARKPAGVAA